MDTFQPTDDDFFEDVPSPFEKNFKTESKSASKRHEKFSRPFGAAPVEAPAVFESKTRKGIATPQNTELIHRTRVSALDEAVDYLDEEEIDEKAVTRTRHSSKKTKASSSIGIVRKVGWGVIVLLIVRLVTMERGVWDYFKSESMLKDKREELQRIQKENNSIRKEIGRIQFDKGYQKQLAKEHLGVIAADEFLILFGSDSETISTENDRPL